MTWNYRVVAVDFYGEMEYGIYEVYYDSFGQPISRTEDVAPVVGTDMDELRRTVAAMATALDKPVLTDADFVWGDLGETEHLS